MASAKNPNKPSNSAPASQVPDLIKQQQLAAQFDYGEHSGTGFENTDQDDFTIPFLGLLQKNSPECDDDSERRIKEAKPGMLINSVTKELYSSEQGVIFVPVTTQHVFVEWRPREAGGGIVGRHEKDSEVVRNARATGEFGDLKVGQNDLVETFYMFGYTLANVGDTTAKEPIVVAFNSTKIKVYRSIMQRLRTVKSRPPLYANRLLIKSVPQKNVHGPFHNFDIVPAIQNDVLASLIPPRTEDGSVHPLMEFGKVLNEQISSGDRKMSDEARMGRESSDEAGGGDADDPDNKPQGKKPGAKMPF